MNPPDAAERAACLRREIQRHNRLYYVLAQPEVDDAEYDRLYGELENLEAQHPELVTPDSPTQRVGGEPLKGFRHVRHLTPMLSLGKAEDVRQLDLFEARVRKELRDETFELIVEPKVDGVSISVHYERGQFRLGATRGNGTEGDDISENLRTVRAIPLRLNTDSPPELLEARGEAFMGAQDHAALNATLTEAGEKPFPNTRNATAGSLKLLDSRIVAQRPIRAVFYAIGATRGVKFDTHQQELETLQAFGLPIPQLRWKCTSMVEALKRAEELKRREHELPFEIDGVVIKINSVRQAQRLRPTAKAPSSAIAYKPKHWLRQAQTRLRDITVQVGRTGVLTPVAELETVFLDGTQISRATLHNEDETRRKDIRVGDIVVIERAGRVIPAVVRVVLEKRTGKAGSFRMPTHCPTCGSHAVRRKQTVADRQEVALCCENFQCPDQRGRRMAHFAGRRALDIEGLGDTVADALVARGLVEDPLDLFQLEREQLSGLNLGSEEQPRVLGEKNAERIIAARERSRSMPLSRWLHALAVPNVGETIALQLAATHRTIKELAESRVLRSIAAQREQRVKSPALGEVGPVVARSVLEFFASEYGRAVLEGMRRWRINPHGQARSAVSSAALVGKAFVLTGTLESMSRDDAAERIRSLGGSVSASVSGKTSFLVVGENPGGKKLQAADRHGIPALSEAELLEMLEVGAEGAAQMQSELNL